MTRGKLRRNHEVHWEKMQWFVRKAITASDVDGGTYAGLYVVEVQDRDTAAKGHDFMFFEFKHELAKPDPNSGQAKSISALVEQRLKRTDRFMWVQHNATGDDKVDIYPGHIVHWYAYRGGDKKEVARGNGWETLAEYCLEWSRTAGRLVDDGGVTMVAIDAEIERLEQELNA